MSDLRPRRARGRAELDGVESVDVSLERASVMIGLRPGNRITLPQLRQIIRNNGFSAKDATVTAIGTVIEPP
ncbi:MAG TPA: hypothetical protein VFT47_00430 [Vicinamibacterales bacterium]|nr:hypothetical protein [Vicinamibacterales bacterium]